MSESVLPFSEGVDGAVGSTASMSGGALLRQAREAQGLHIGALAVALKVPVAKLEALEADRFDVLPDMVFVRALAASVCRTLKVDSTLILDKLPRTAAPYLKVDEAGINTPFHSHGDAVRLSFLRQLSSPFVLAVIVLLVGIAVLVVFPFRAATEIASAPQAAGHFPMESVPVATSPATEDVMPAEAAPPILAASMALSGPDGSEMPGPSVVASGGPVAGSNASPPLTIVPGSGATTGLLVFKARGASWIEVIDAKGIVLVRKTLGDGEVVGVTGALPLSIVVGRADSTEVQVRGKSFDLTGIAKNNVARFEVK